jgi:hypothetical protein
VNDKIRTLIIGIVLVVVISLVFLVLPITPNLIIAYIFALLGIISLGLGVVFLTRENVKIPQDIPFLTSAWTYLIVNLIVSVLGLVFSEHLTPIFFLIIHIVILAGFVIWMVILTGKEHIDVLDTKTKEKVFNIRMMLADLDAIKEKASDLPSPVREKTQKDLKTIYDAVRYSDPMSHPSLKEYDHAIKESIILIDRAVSEKDEEDLLNLTVRIQRQIKDRNNRVKFMK